MRKTRERATRLWENWVRMFLMWRILLDSEQHVLFADAGNTFVFTKVYVLNWITAPCRLSMCVYSVYLLLNSLPESCFLFRNSGQIVLLRRVLNKIPLKNSSPSPVSLHIWSHLCVRCVKNKDEVTWNYSEIFTVNFSQKHVNSTYILL
jgi:hypothetical protein